MKNDNVCQIKESKKIEIPTYTTHDLAQYLAQQRGERITEQRGDSFRVGLKAGSISVHYNDQNKAVATDFAGDRQERDLFGWIAECEGIARFSDQLKRAYDVLGKPLETSATKATNCFEPKKKYLPLNIPEDLKAILRSGLHSEEFKDVLQKRGIHGLDIDSLESVGFMPSGCHKIVKNPNPGGSDIDIKQRSLVVFDECQIKSIPLNADGYREDKNNAARRPQNIGCISPIFRAIDHSKPLYLVEGEFDALALISVGLQAIPCKPEGENTQAIQSLNSPILAYDWDKPGRGYTKKALALNANAVDVSCLYSTSSSVKDPNDFVKADQNAGFFFAIEANRQKALLEERIEQQQQQPDGEKRKDLSPAEKARMMTDGWMFDDFWDEFISPEGERFNFDEAIGLFSRRDIKIRPSTAAAELQSMVKSNRSRHCNGLERIVRQRANEYSEADNGNIDRYCARCGFDAYETRRMHLWLYQICGRAVLQGEKTDSMLVLAGKKQDTAKTSFFDGISRALIGEGVSYYSFFGGKDADMLLSTRPVLLIDELDQIFKKIDVATLKSKITQATTHLRAPYERSAKTRLCCAVFGATTNEENPIPTGEDEARRYWVINPKRNMNFLRDDEAVGLIREAAFLTLKALEENKSDYQHCTIKGKIWVPSQEEKDETVKRNAHKKAEDAHSIAIEAGIISLEAKATQEERKTLYSAKRWATAFETGDGSIVGISDCTWKAPKASASGIARLITARCKRQTTRVKGLGVAGYSLEAIKEVFIEPMEEIEATETSFKDETVVSAETVSATDDNPFIDHTRPVFRFVSESATKATKEDDDIEIPY